jgi:hypothetical protein
VIIKAGPDTCKAVVGFLRTLAEEELPPCVISRHDDRARQICCKRGLVTFDKTKNSPRGAGWKITPLGKELAYQTYTLRGDTLTFGAAED